MASISALRLSVSGAGGATLPAWVDVCVEAIIGISGGAMGGGGGGGGGAATGGAGGGGGGGYKEIATALIAKIRFYLIDLLLLRVGRPLLVVVVAEEPL